MTVTAIYRSRELQVRQLRYHLYEWGAPEAPLVVLLHGWMDSGATWQFFVDALALPVRCVAFDWRGHGRSEWAHDAIYQHTDYLADLDFLLDALSPAAPVLLVGHSLGGNIAALYAGVRPERVRALVNVDGFGLWSGDPERLAGYLRGWLEELHKESMRRVHPSLESVIARLADVSTRLTPERARFVATEWSEGDADKGYRLRTDPGLRRRPPNLYRQDEAVATWRAIQAPLLWIEPDDSDNKNRFGLSPAMLDERRNAVTNVTRVLIRDTGHMIHWEQPEALASHARPFIEQHLRKGESE